MNWWKRLIFSCISLIWGFCSLDYLYYAFRLLVGADETATQYHAEEHALMQLVGAGMFLFWFFLIGIYYLVIKRFMPKIDLIEEDRKTGKMQVKRKWTDILLQTGFLLSGMILRFAYVMFLVL